MWGFSFFKTLAGFDAWYDYLRAFLIVQKLYYVPYAFVGFVKHVAKAVCCKGFMFYFQHLCKLHHAHFQIWLDSGK